MILSYMSLVALSLVNAIRTNISPNETLSFSDENKKKSHSDDQDTADSLTFVQSANAIIADLQPQSLSSMSPSPLSLKEFEVATSQ